MTKEMEEKRAPRSLREELLCSAFAGALRRGSVSIDDDFFALGGDSLKATFAMSEIRDRLDQSLAARSFFQLRTVEKLAATSIC